VPGSGRRITGETVEGDEPADMFFGTEVHMRLHDTAQVFELRIPKLLKDAQGQWRIADPPELDGQFLLFIEMGFPLTQRLLSFEHYPYPLQTGNYWTYQVRREDRELSTDIPSPSEEVAEGTGEGPDDGGGPVAGEPPDPFAEDESAADLERYRDEVVDREDYDGYALVRIRRTYDDPERTTERFAYLMTAYRLYRCNADCRRNIEDISWLLAHLSHRTPELIFPLEPGMGWRTGGRLDADGEYQSRSQYESADVPAGNFVDAVCITKGTTLGREHRYFVRGIGVVLTRTEAATQITYAELIDYRIIP
jgi:hypothetical protein